MPAGVMTILAVTMDNAKMHIRHEREMSRLLSQLHAEHNKQIKVSATALPQSVEVLRCSCRCVVPWVKQRQSIARIKSAASDGALFEYIRHVIDHTRISLD